MRDPRPFARSSTRSSETGEPARATYERLAAFQGDDGQPWRAEESPVEHARTQARSSGPGWIGWLAATLWFGLAIAAPLAYWGAGPVLAQHPAFLAALGAIAVFPAFSILIGAAAARDAAGARNLAAQLIDQNDLGAGLGGEDERASWRRTLAEAEDAATAIGDLLTRERAAAGEAATELKSSIEAAAQTAHRQVRLVREASRLMGEEARTVEATFAETVAAVERMAQTLQRDLESAERLHAQARDLAARAQADVDAAAARLEQATAAARAQSDEAARASDAHAIPQAAKEPPPRARAARRSSDPIRTREQASAASSELARDLKLDWLASAPGPAIEMLQTMGVAPCDVIDEADFAAIVRRSRLGAAARRRAVADAAPAAIARIARIVSRDADVKRAAAAFRRNPGFDAAGPMDDWSAERDVARAYLLVDAALG